MQSLVNETQGIFLVYTLGTQKLYPDDANTQALTF